MFASHDRKIINMSTMLTRLGIDSATPAQQQLGALFTDAVRACQMCSAAEVCRDWLARGEGPLQRPPAFCPNASRFERVRNFSVGATKPP
jgi:hypothetical protein